ncbi:MAG: helix-hairpin-helix domain-containing protein [Ignavibacteriaceae bacterium]
MFNFIKKLSEKFSLTRTEIKVFGFLSLVLILGAGYKFLFKSEKIPKSKNFDYSAEDSLFNLAVNSTEKGSGIEDYDVDYKQEVLDFNNGDLENKSKVIPEEKSININTAGIDELSGLPGIGEKIAQGIIDYRTKNGRIDRIEVLLEIKGIGNSKLNKIKKYIYIDQ